MKKAFVYLTASILIIVSSCGDDGGGVTLTEQQQATLGLTGTWGPPTAATQDSDDILPEVNTMTMTFGSTTTNGVPEPTTYNFAVTGDYSGIINASGWNWLNSTTTSDIVLTGGTAGTAQSLKLVGPPVTESTSSITVTFTVPGSKTQGSYSVTLPRQ